MTLPIIVDWIYCQFCGITYSKKDIVCPNCGTAPKKFFKRGSRYVTR